METEGEPNEVKHVFFLKVHKAASSTVQNVMLRFALSRGLNVMLPRNGHILSESSKTWLRNAIPPPHGVQHYDILCNHLVFEEESVRYGLHPDTVFIGIVRQPFEQFVSAFMYYRNKYSVAYLKKIGGEDPVSTYLTQPGKWETLKGRSSMTHNRMSFDFGLEPMDMQDEHQVAKYIQYLNDTFHLVLVSERFDESMILMKRRLGWGMKDVLYFKNNVFKHKEKNYTEEQRNTHRRFNMADYTLYEHFSQLFDKRVNAEGKSFADEVKTYSSVRERVGQFCTSHEEPP
nr:hypothetical protein BaRGS_017559 [Batillaria attramentaria]